VGFLWVGVDGAENDWAEMGMAELARRRGSEPREVNAPVVDVEANESGGMMCENDRRWPERPWDGNGTAAVVVAVGEVYGILGERGL